MLHVHIQHAVLKHVVRFFEISQNFEFLTVFQKVVFNIFNIKTLYFKIRAKKFLNTLRAVFDFFFAICS